MTSGPPDRNPYPLYNTTFTLHRLSPLYVGHDVSLNNTALLPYAMGFRDIIVGEVLRGVRVGLGSDEDVLARVGALQTVAWKVLVDDDSWDYAAGLDESQIDEAMELGPARGIYITVAYERATYVAILLRSKDTPRGGEQAGFQRFPLLLTRMPSSLRDTLTEFLQTSFDARISVLRLSQSYLPVTLESYVQSCLKGEDEEQLSPGEASDTLKKVLKDVQVVIGFDLPTGNASVKSVDIVIARDDLPQFIERGNKIQTGSMGEKEQKRPFMDALILYIHTHLALNFRHDSVNILRVACGAFVLGTEGKVKLTDPAASGVEIVQGRATTLLIERLIQLAERQGVFKVGNG
jgi:hypothetical protein